jgi:hypothetical protein
VNEDTQTEAEMKGKKEKDRPEGLELTVEQMSLTNAICVEAIVNLLIKKGICTREEALDEVKRVRLRGPQRPDDHPGT